MCARSLSPASGLFDLSAFNLLIEKKKKKYAVEHLDPCGLSQKLKQLAVGQMLMRYSTGPMIEERAC